MLVHATQAKIEFSGMRLSPIRIRVVALLISLIAALAPPLSAQTGGGVAAGEPRFRVVRSVSGSRGSEQGGRFVVDDPRTIFYVPADTQVIVYFEWDGPLGPHHFEGYWRDPERKAVIISDFKYEAKQKRFGGYWSLNLTPTITPGLWSLEAHVDGELAGSHTFQIIVAAKPAGEGPVRHVLAPSEIYKRASAASVFIHKVNSKGFPAPAGSGFFIADNVVLTAFQTVDGATSLRVVLPGGRRIDTDRVLDWSRWGDWALLRVEAQAPGTLERAPADSWAVGDRCYSLGTPTEGNHVIIDENIVGTSNFPEAGQRISLSYSAASTGAPVLNEYGEVIALAGGNIYPGMTGRSQYEVAPAGTLSLQTGLATPITLVRDLKPGVPGRTLAELAKMLQFVPLLMEQQNLVYGMITSRVDTKKNEFPASNKHQFEFRKGQDAVALLLVWGPREKVKGSIALEVYDLNNAVVGHSAAGKLNLNRGESSTQVFRLDPSPLKLRIYRVAVLQDSNPMWRGYFRLVQ